MCKRRSVLKRRKPTLTKGRSSPVRSKVWQLTKGGKTQQQKGEREEPFVEGHTRRPYNNWGKGKGGSTQFCRKKKEERPHICYLAAAHYALKEGGKGGRRVLRKGRTGVLTYLSFTRKGFLGGKAYREAITNGFDSQEKEKG